MYLSYLVPHSRRTRAQIQFHPRKEMYVIAMSFQTEATSRNVPAALKYILKKARLGFADFLIPPLTLAPVFNPQRSAPGIARLFFLLILC